MNKKEKSMIIVTIIIALVTITIAFAAMSRTLNIKGEGKVDPVNWDIHFKNVEFVSKSKNASVVGVPTPTAGNTSITIDDIDVILRQPGDYVTYTADIENSGDIDAEINLITLPEFNTRQNELLTFTAEYTENQENGSKKIGKGDMLYAREVKNITITFTYKDITDESRLPKSPEEIVVSYSIDYIQSAKKRTTTVQNTENTYYGTSGSYKIGDTINTSKYQESSENVQSAYIKYTTDSNNKITSIEGCKKGTSNASAVCLTAVDTAMYDHNKSVLAEYFGGDLNNLPKECSEDNNGGTMEFTCANSYVVLAVDNDGGIFINDIENKKSCVANPMFGIFSCK